MYMYMYAMQVSVLEGELEKVREGARARVIQRDFFACIQQTLKW